MRTIRLTVAILSWAVEGLLMPLRQALAHPLGLAILLASLILGAALLTVPSLQVWSDRSAWLLAWGLLAYGATVLVLKGTRAERSSAELRQIRAIRSAMATRLADVRAGDSKGGRADLVRVLSEAIAMLDEQVIPSLQQIVTRQAALTRELASFEHGERPAPEPRVLDRLREIHIRQQTAIKECVQQAANADATLVALLQESDDTRVANLARDWAAGLLTLHDILTEVLSDDTLPPGTETSISDHRLPEPQILVTPPAPVELVVPPVPIPEEDQFHRLVEESLRNLNNPSRLSECGLISQLPYTLAAARQASTDASGRPPTPLEEAKALSDVIKAAIERLKPDDDRAGEALQYHILHDEYVLGRPIKAITNRQSVSEATFHRHRRQAVDVLVRELRRREQLLAAEDESARSRHNGTAVH